MGFKKMLLGDKEPDMSDPRVRERFERNKAAGEKFARRMRLDRLYSAMQGWCATHRRAYFSIVFTAVGFLFVLNVWRLASAYRIHAGTAKGESAVEQQRGHLHLHRHHGETRQPTPEEFLHRHKAQRQTDTQTTQQSR